MGHPAVLLTVALATLLAAAAGAPILRQGSRNKLLLVSFDGFRWNYDQDVHTPNLDAMALDGVKARYMTPAFVTLTSPCHFTLVTGECRLEWGPGVVGAEKPRNPCGEPQCMYHGSRCRNKGETREGTTSLGGHSTAPGSSTTFTIGDN